MNQLLIVVTAMSISMVVIPLMVAMAPRFGLMDYPDPRKVHSKPIPRVGGVGIVLGALFPVAVLQASNPLILSYLIGCAVLLLFGVWDDVREIGHYRKFFGQFLAVLPVVIYADLQVRSFPVVALGLPDYLSIPFTVFAMVGVINAINHSDGLDGLAGGESLISLAAIAYLAYLVDGDLGVVVALAAIGGIFGFLRYNTHPAWVFMGDAGSQFLGFTTAFLLVLLTQRVDPALSPAVVLLLAGLPVADILVVLVKRVRGGMNWFRATSNHVHHRLLRLGFSHLAAVVLIYSVQMAFVTSAVVLRYAPDELIILVYVLACLILFGVLGLLERSGWNASRMVAITMPYVRQGGSRFLVIAPRRLLIVALPTYLFAMSLLTEQVPPGFSIVAAVVLALMLLDLAMLGGRPSFLRRGLIYVGAALVVYLADRFGPAATAGWSAAETTFYAVVAVCIGLAVRFSPRRRKVEFRANGTDYLITFLLLSSFVALKGTGWEIGAVGLVVKIAIVFYASEWMITESRGRWNVLTVAVMAAMFMLALRGGAG